MRWSLYASISILIIIPAFSTPIPRMILRRRGLFEDTLRAGRMGYRRAQGSRVPGKHLPRTLYQACRESEGA